MITKFQNGIKTTAILLTKLFRLSPNVTELSAKNDFNIYGLENTSSADLVWKGRNMVHNQYREAYGSDDLGEIWL